MASGRPFCIAWIVCAYIVFAVGTAAFTGNFDITNLVLDCPSEVDATSTDGSYLSFDFTDQDTPNNPSVHCCLEWVAGQTPYPLPVEGTCSDNNVTIWVPDGAYKGFSNMTVNLAHEYEDDSVGQPPYNILTKYACLYLDYPYIPEYECNVDTACCESCEGATMIAVVTEATA